MMLKMILEEVSILLLNVFSPNIIRKFHSVFFEDDIAEILSDDITSSSMLLVRNEAASYTSILAGFGVVYELSASKTFP